MRVKTPDSSPPAPANRLRSVVISRSNAARYETATDPSGSYPVISKRSRATGSGLIAFRQSTFVPSTKEHGSHLSQPDSRPGQLQRQATGDHQAALLVIDGNWTLRHYAALRSAVEGLRQQVSAGDRVELAGLGELDTAGAGLLVELLGPARISRLEEWAPQLPAAHL